MKDEIKKAFEKFEKDGWITINPHLNHESLAATFADIVLKDMTVRGFLNMFKLD